MKIEWLGHASFLITTANGKRIVTDPFGGIGISFPKVSAEIVTMSHDHFDHNAASAVGGKFKTVNKPGSVEIEGVRISGYGTFHDESRGSARGANIVFKFTADGVNVCHLGDLGHRLTVSDAKQIGPVDVLLIPVGGTFTIDAAGAMDVVETLAPKIVVPMHYKIPGLTVGVSGVEPFIKRWKSVEKLKALELTGGALSGGARCVVLEKIG
jgi:L-ascorbate metabolism protein UlaG (beta-lactamase superfamily)